MSKQGGQKLKLIYVLDILKKYSDEENPLNSVDIAEKLSQYGIEAERKSIYDDIAVLEQYGYDVIKRWSQRLRTWALLKHKSIRCWVQP